MSKIKHIARAITSDQPLSVRADQETGKRYLEGYAIVFNQRSKLIREWGETFYEVIEPGAPDNVLADTGLNVIATVDHDRAKMLGRTISGTLQLVKDERGVKYIIELPDTNLGRDIYEQVKRGDYYESSFIFSVADKGVRYDTGEDIPVRYVSNFATMRDVAIVVDGAYANTDVSARAWDQEQTQDTPPADQAEQKRAAAADILQKRAIILNLQ